MDENQLEVVAAKHLNKIAIVHDKTSISYGAFFELVDSYSKVLVKYNKPLVLLESKKSIFSLAIIHALFINGGSYCFIDIETPENTKETIFNKLKPDISIKYDGSELVSGTRLKAMINYKHINRSADFYEDPIAYIKFTSGSTGDPKGVVISRDSLIKFLRWYICELKISHTDVLSAYSDFNFDLSIPDIYSGLFSGATTVLIANKFQKLMPTKFISEHQITIWNSVPSVINIMRKTYNEAKDTFASLRLLNFCGEPLTVSQIKFLFKNISHSKVQNTYGPTEATVFISNIWLSENNYKKFSESSVSLGKPLPHMSLKKLTITPDTTIFEPFGDDETGEAVIIGPQVAIGYFGDKNLTEKNFIFDSITGVRGYRTGDVLLYKGQNYYFVGRTDNQIKRNGYRVELEEIERVADKLGFYKNLAIFAGNDLILCIESEQKIKTTKVQAALREFLPKYYFPIFVQIVNEIPLTKNGKKDRKKMVSTYLDGLVK